MKALPPPPPPLPQPFTFPSPPKGGISPSILLIIVILAVIFFVSGLLHLLVRYLMRPIARDPDEISATAMEGQLQQLFHLHDAGVDQTFIDALPVFLYRAITGLKDPFDCAVCLCEFAGDDRLRLLPKCSHAFHLDCIDRWLLSHSTCPLCRTGLLSELTSNCSPPLWCALLSDESSREISPAPEDEACTDVVAVAVAVRLGKIKNMDVGSSDGKLDGRRCHSMGSYEYVMDEGSLHVTIKQCAAAAAAATAAARKVAKSEYDCHSRRVELPDARITGRKESFSVSKIWMRPRTSATATATATATVSFRLPLQWQASAAMEKSASEVDLDVEMGSCNESVVSEAPSLSRMTLLWIMGRQSKVGVGSFT